MLAALRFRRGQAALLALLSAVVTSCAVLMPVGLASLNQSLVRGRFAALSPNGRYVDLSAHADPPASLPTFTEMTAVVPPELRAVLGSPIQSASYTTGSVGGVPTQLETRSDMCAHIILRAGRCAAGTDEALVTPAFAKDNKVSVGSSLTVARAGGTSTLTVTGLYNASADDPYWRGELLERSTGASISVGPGESVAPNDTVLTTPSTLLTAAFAGVRINQAWPIIGNKLTADNVDQIGIAADGMLQSVSTRASEGLTPISIASPFGSISDQVKADRGQARVILPVLLAQLAVLLLVVLGLVLNAAVEQRARETALARLRGRGARGARRLIMNELAIPLLAGVPLGILLAYAVDWFARTFWLMPGIAPALTPMALVAAGVAALVLLVVLLGTTRSAGRGSIVALLRGSTATRGSVAARVLDIVVITAAMVAVAAMATGALTGPIALVTPSLLALAVGLALALVLVPIARRIGTNALAKGRTSSALAWLGTSRRPAVRRIVAVITVASALAVFSADAYAVGQRNREARAGVETGSAAAIWPAATDPGSDWANVQQAVADVDPRQLTSTALITASPGGDAGVATVAGDAAAYMRIMTKGRSPANLGALRKGAEPLTVTGTKLTATVRTDSMQLQVPHFNGGGTSWQSDGADLSRTPDSTGMPTDPSERTLRINPPTLSVVIVRNDGVQFREDLGAVSAKAGGTVTVTTTLPCASACTLVGLALGHPDSTDPGQNTAITKARTDLQGALVRAKFDITWSGAQSTGLSNGAGWAPYNSTPDSMTAESKPGGLVVNWSYNGPDFTMQSRAASEGLQAVVSDDIWDDKESIGAISGNSIQVPNPSGGTDLMAQMVGHVPYLPGFTTKSAFLDVTAATKDGVRVDGFRVRPVILTSDASDAHLARIRQALARHGMAVGEVRKASALKADYDRSASAWGLQFAIAVAVGAVLISVIVLVVVMAMSWRERARDIAGLRLAGVRGGTPRRAAVIEQVAVIALAVVVGGICGAVGNVLVMKRLPLFAIEPTIPIIDLRLALGWVVGAMLVTLIVLCTSGFLLAGWLVRRATLDKAKVGA